MKLGIIGTGNMGGTLLRGVISAGVIAPQDVFIYDSDSKKAAAASNETGAVLCGSGAELAQKSDLTLLAVKPVYAGQVLEGIRECFAGKTLISIAAGLTAEHLGGCLGNNARIIRVMPNMPAAVFEGMGVISFPPSSPDEERAFVTKLFSTVGKVCELPERLFDGVTALTGSSPAYVFIMIEAMADAAVMSGIPRDMAYTLAAQAVLGSAKMVLELTKHPAELKDQVCSPAGTTIEAVAALEKNGFRSAIISAMDACVRKSRELGQM